MDEDVEGFAVDDLSFAVNTNVVNCLTLDKNEIESIGLKKKFNTINNDNNLKTLNNPVKLTKA